MGSFSGVLPSAKHAGGEKKRESGLTLCGRIETENLIRPRPSGVLYEKRMDTQSLQQDDDKNGRREVGGTTM